MEKTKEVKEILREIKLRIKDAKRHHYVCRKHEIWSSLDMWEFKINTLVSLRDWITYSKAKKK